MDRRTLEIKLGSARDLSNVNYLMKMDAYVVIELAGAGESKATQKFKSPVDREGGCNPNWNFMATFTVDEAAVQQNRLSVVFTLRCDRSLGDKDVGEVHVPVKELLESAGNGDRMQHLSYQVRKPSGNPQGVFSFSYKFGGKTVIGDAKPPAPEIWPENAFPAPVGPSLVGYGGVAVYPPPPSSVPPEVYPPPATATGYGVYPPPAYSAYTPAASVTGYGYQQQPAPAYVYPPPAYGHYPPAPEKKKMGLGMGAGLAGGLLGGLLIGDLVSDAVFDDAGGFDF